MFEDRSTHEEAEKQSLMGDMEKNRISDYNKIVVEFGWITFFGPCFPAAPLLGIISNNVIIGTEIDNIKQFKKRGEPVGVIDVGRWIELIERIAEFSIVNSIGLVIFTSEQLGTIVEGYEWSKLVIFVFMVENLLLIFRYILALLIPDEPEEIIDERRSMKHRVSQIKREIQNKELLERIKTEPIDLVKEVISDLHKDNDLAALLVPKLLKGCNEFEDELREAREDDGEQSDGSASSKGSVKKENLREKQARMLKKLKMLRDRHKNGE